MCWDSQQQCEFEFLSNHLTLNAVLVAAVFIGILIIAMTHELFELHLMRTAKELLMITLPGIAGGFALTMYFDRLRGKLWPVFVGICPAHTIGKATILGWLMGEF